LTLTLEKPTIPVFMRDVGFFNHFKCRKQDHIIYTYVYKEKYGINTDFLRVLRKKPSSYV